MRKLLPFLFLSIFFFSSSSIRAQNKKEDRPYSIGAKLLFIDYGNPNGIDSLGITNGIEGLVIRKINNKFNVALAGKVGVANVSNDINNRTIFSLDALAQYKLLGDEGRVSPYLLAGAALGWERVLGINPQVPLGVGSNIMVGDNSYVNLQFEYRLSGETNRNNLHFGLGYIYNINLEGKDEDGDGVSDLVDKCPSVPGEKDLEGCPDRDKDGVEDSKDLCPDDKGLAEFNGCPDTDTDGIIDSEDACPQVAGLPNMNGCPDQDNDGVADNNDDCPTVAGTKKTGGCPDKDGDGVVDKEDRCPDEFGLASAYGCPVSDKDKDGIGDETDKCPNEAGPEGTGGCPDQDGDGVADKDDRCPTASGTYSGCPDSDGDGVMDADDSCPNEAGIAANKGCPELKKEVQEVLTFAMRAVQFETGKAQLKEESYSILDQIVDIMNQYPAYSLAINGHTDNMGLESNNQILSEERAKSCFQYLASKGVSAARLGYAGYGETEPIADNSTPAGRKLNRRVEFDLYIK